MGDEWSDSEGDGGSDSSGSCHGAGRLRPPAAAHGLPATALFEPMAQLLEDDAEYDVSAHGASRAASGSRAAASRSGSQASRGAGGSRRPAQPPRPRSHHELYNEAVMFGEEPDLPMPSGGSGASAVVSVLKPTGVQDGGRGDADAGPTGAHGGGADGKPASGLPPAGPSGGAAAGQRSRLGSIMQSFVSPFVLPTAERSGGGVTRAGVPRGSVVAFAPGRSGATQLFALSGDVGGDASVGSRDACVARRQLANQARMRHSVVSHVSPLARSALVKRDSRGARGWDEIGRMSGRSRSSDAADDVETPAQAPPQRKRASQQAANGAAARRVMPMSRLIDARSYLFAVWADHHHVDVKVWDGTCGCQCAGGGEREGVGPEGGGGQASPIVSLSAALFGRNTMQHHATPCSTVQHHAAPCNTLQHHAIPCSTMQYQCSTMQYLAAPCNTVQHCATPCSTVQHHAAPCNTMQHHAIPCSTMQHHAAPCNTMQHHATLCSTMQHQCIGRPPRYQSQRMAEPYSCNSMQQQPTPSTTARVCVALGEEGERKGPGGRSRSAA
eukprot:361679-Chlamydomonas_euryale.AAC.2